MTPAEPHGWTLATLHEYLLRLIEEKDRFYVEKFSASEKAVSAAIAAADRATEKAEAATEKRFEGVNEMRQMAVDNLRVTMPRQEQESINAALKEKLDAHEQRFAQLSGQRVGSKDAWGYIVAGISLLVALAAVLYK